MKPYVVGTREDVAGFALAGVDGVVCATREEAAVAIARADDDTLVFVSADVAPDEGDRITPLIIIPPR